eukprot:15432020-Alexandrium_andersonii.AAC.1
MSMPRITLSIFPSSVAERVASSGNKYINEYIDECELWVKYVIVTDAVERSWSVPAALFAERGRWRGEAAVHATAQANNGLRAKPARRLIRRGAWESSRIHNGLQ